MLTNYNEKLKQIISTLIFNSVCNTAHKRQAYEIDIINRYSKYDRTQTEGRHLLHVEMSTLYHVSVLTSLLVKNIFFFTLNLTLDIFHDLSNREICFSGYGHFFI